MKKNTTKIILIMIISITFMLGLVACNGEENSEVPSESIATTTNTTVEAELDENVTDNTSEYITENTLDTTETTEVNIENQVSNENITISATTEETVVTTTEVITTEATTEHIHNWVAQFDTIHHNAVTEEVEVTKQVPKIISTSTTKCKSCGWLAIENKPMTYSEHVSAMGTEIIILWGEEHEVAVCRDGCQTVPYEYTVYETVTVTEVQIISEAYDEKVLKGYYCNECSQWQ